MHFWSTCIRFDPIEVVIAVVVVVMGKFLGAKFQRLNCMENRLNFQEIKL